MAFSRSETEDRRQWPWAPPSFLMPHCIPPRPPSRPARDPQRPKLHKHDTDELRRGGAPGRDRRGGEETPGGGCLALLPPHPRLLLIQAGTPLPEMHSSASLRGWSLGNKAVSENTHRLCGWISNVVFFVGGLVFVLYYFVCVETLGSVTCYICCGHWIKWPVSSWLKQREI